jgi:adenylate cyclase
MVVLNAPAGDEAPILLRNFLKVERPSLLICRNLSSAQAIVSNAAEDVACLICSDKPVSPAKSILPGKGIENLTDLNLQINETLGAMQPKRLALEILSDVLLRHKALQTRKWLNELLERLRSKGITALAILNPYMHTAEETQALVDMFDESIEVFEREGRKCLRINWTHGIEVSQREFPLEELVAEKKINNALDARRVAVLPFANMSPDPNDEYFADGMTEELITSLSRVKQLTVIARTSVMKYKGSETSASDVGKKLNVGSLIEGSVRKAGNRVRITAQLIDTSTEGHLWAENYDKNLDDIFAVQSEIAEKVVGELKTQLLDSEKRTLEKKPTENTEAYTCFLQGRELLMEENEGSVRRAIVQFEKAIELDSKFARAYVGIAACHQLLGDRGHEPADVSVSTVRPLLEHALILDPNLPEAHAALSDMFFNEDDVLRAEAEARRALELNPSLPDTYHALFELAALKEDPDAMVREIETAYRLDPIRPRFIQLLGMAYVWTGREEEALEHWKKTEELAPIGTYRGMTEYYLARGNVEKAKEFHAKVEKLEPTRPPTIWMGGVIAAQEGDREKALLAIKRIEDAKIGPLGLNYVAYVYHALGDFDAFFEYMNRALETHAVVTSVLMYSHLFDRARADPRYREIVERLRKQCGLTK